MMLATVWAVDRGRETCGFDWYDEGERQVRRELEATPAYIEKARLLDSLAAANPITKRFDERHGDYWSGSECFGFYNGPEYNRYQAELYRLSLAVYGDSPINLRYESRNRRMMDLAWPIIRSNAGRKVALVTGSEHKHYFDRDLAAHDGIVVADLSGLLPLVDYSPRPAVRAFLEEENDLPYFADGWPADTTAYGRTKMMHLVHGPNMDWLPDAIPARNVGLAARVLDRWRAMQPRTPAMDSEEGWVRFLGDDCEAAIESLERVIDVARRGIVLDAFVEVYSHRNLGLCYDLLDRRQMALRQYALTRRLARGTRLESNLDLTLRDYETVPYRRGRAAEPLGARKRWSRMGSDASGGRVQPFDRWVVLGIWPGSHSHRSSLQAV